MHTNMSDSINSFRNMYFWIVYFFYKIMIMVVQHNFQQYFKCIIKQSIILMKKKPEKNPDFHIRKLIVTVSDW